MKITKYIQNPKLLLYFLDLKGLYRLKDIDYLKCKYQLTFGKELNLNNPQSFNEKLQWLKLHNINPDYPKMVDKYEAKKYVEKIIGKEHIVPTYGIYNNFNEINFDKLPNQFVIKGTHDSNSAIIIRNKNNMNLKRIKKKIKKTLKENKYYISREWPYKNIKPRIIIEKYMYNGSINNQLCDYKFFCFNGKPTFIYVSKGLENHKTAKIDFLDMNFKRTNFGRADFKKFDILPKKPKTFDEMINYARILSKDIPFVRVDLYEVNNIVYFSELTFFPCGGFIRFTPNDADNRIGKMLDISLVKENEK